MKRIAFNFAAALSALLFAAVATLWVRSYWRMDLGLAFLHGGRVHGMASVAGRIYLFASNAEVAGRAFSIDFMTDSADQANRLALSAADTPAIDKARFGFGYHQGSSTALGGGAKYRAVAVPHWLPLILFALPGIMWLRYHRRQKHRQKHGLCLNCGYDLRASPKRCPECGQPNRRALERLRISLAEANRGEGVRASIVLAEIRGEMGLKDQP